MNQITESGLWAMSTLGEVLTRSDERINPVLNAKVENYIGLEHIASGTGRLLDTSAVSSDELKSTKNVFHPGDILYGKLRPYLNKVYLAEDSGMCSTDLWVLRATPVIDPVFASYYLRSTTVLEQVGQLATGANLPRVSAIAFDRIVIPLPSLPEQRRIVAILSEADEIRRLRKEANEKVQEFVQAYFFDIFGDPVTNPKQWDIRKLGDLAVFMTSGPRNWAAYYSPQGARFIRVQNLTNHRLNYENMVFITPPNTVEARRSKVFPNDILFSITGVVGMVAVAPEDIGDAYVSQHVAIVRLKPDIDPHFVATFLAHSAGGQLQIGSQQYGQTKPGFSLNDIRSLNVFMPPLDHQRQFVKDLASINTLNALQGQSYSHLDTLFQSLLAQAFSGELTAEWREMHMRELERAARERDALLEELHGAKLRVVAAQPEISLVEGRRIELIDELTNLQRVLITLVDRQPESYFSASRLEVEIRGHLDKQEQYQPELDSEGLYAGFAGLDCSLDALRRDLHFLAALGLIREVALQLEDGFGNMHFATVYRSLRVEDDIQQDDLTLLADEMAEEVVA